MSSSNMDMLKRVELESRGKKPGEVRDYFMFEERESFVVIDLSVFDFVKMRRGFIASLFV